MYELRVISGTDQWIIPFETISITEILNGGITGTLNLNYLALERYSQLFNLRPDDIFASDYAEWKLYRNSTILYGGIFSHRSVSGSKTQGTSYTVNLLGFEYLLKSRYTGNDSNWWYTSTDSADIAWDLIDQTNNDTSTYGDTGITRGLHPTTVDRDNTCRFSNIFDEIVSMSASKKWNGYDWTVSPDKVFDIYYPRGTTKSSIILDDFNIISWSSNRDICTNLGNRIIVIGSGFEDNILYEVVEDTTSMATWGLQEKILSEKNTEIAQNLIDKGDKELDNKSLPRDLITITTSDKSPDIATYNVGDSLPVKINSIAFDKTLRIDKRTLQIQRSGEAIVDLSFQYAT